jgi:hypothetical protein
MTVECLRGSGLPDELRNLGYELTPEPPGERIGDLADVGHDITASRGTKAPTALSGRNLESKDQMTFRRLKTDLSRRGRTKLRRFKVPSVFQDRCPKPLGPFRLCYSMICAGLLVLAERCSQGLSNPEANKLTLTGRGIVCTLRPARFVELRNRIGQGRQQGLSDRSDDFRCFPIVAASTDRDSFRACAMRNERSRSVLYGDHHHRRIALCAH